MAGDGQFKKDNQFIEIQSGPTVSIFSRFEAHHWTSTSLKYLMEGPCSCRRSVSGVDEAEPDDGIEARLDWVCEDGRRPFRPLSATEIEILEF